MSGECLHILLNKLSFYFHNLPLEEIEELFELESNKIKKRKEKQAASENPPQSDDDEDDIPLSRQQTSLEQQHHQPAVYQHLQLALQNFDCSNLLQEICTDASLARKETGKFCYLNTPFSLTAMLDSFQVSRNTTVGSFWLNMLTKRSTSALCTLVFVCGNLNLRTLKLGRLVVMRRGPI